MKRIILMLLYFIGFLIRLALSPLMALMLVTFHPDMNFEETMRDWLLGRMV